MNYKDHYEKLIERAKHRVLVGRIEVHHIVPRCMGGSNEAENLVRLTTEEHFLAHQLLHKIYPKEKGLLFALVKMTGNPWGQRNNKLYGWIKDAVTRETSIRSRAMWQDPEYRAKHKAAMDEVRARPGYREQFSRIHKGRVKSPQECANISKGKTGLKYKPMSAASRANMAEARRKVWAARRANGTHRLIAQKTWATRRALQAAQ